MSTTTERDAAAGGAEQGQHQLEAHEAELERRTRSRQLAVILAIGALAIGIGALAIALSGGSDNHAGRMSGGMMAGAGGHGRFSSAMMGAAAHGTVYVQLGDHWAAPAVSSVRAGEVTFVASNVGRLPHELMVERMPMRFDSPMHPNAAAAQGMLANMHPGRGGRLTMRLRPGRYMLFCSLPGHYAAGQHMTFTVTKP